jgi:hypothetical protein
MIESAAPRRALDGRQAARGFAITMIRQSANKAL